MAELLLELLTEEIPARMQTVAAEELRRLAEIAFEEAHLAFSKLVSFVTPRRLTLHAEGLPLEQPGSVEEKRGPRVGAPQAAIDGFLKSAGLASLDQCEKRATDKGEFYFAVVKRPGQATKDVLPGLLLEIIRGLPWPKSMRFPAAPFRWVRPLQSVVCLLDGRIVKLDLGDVPVGMETRGHRFLTKASFNVSRFADYRQELRNFYVVLDAGERRAMIAEGLAAAAREAQLVLKPDELLLDEVTGLVEWPVVLMGKIGPEFMSLPPEVLTTSMRTHQKYFALLDNKGLDAKGALAPHFLLVSNMRAADGGKAIVAGNERVLRARLSDAKFFWDQDRKQTLESRVPKLMERVFHAKLGSMFDKTSRVMRLAEAVARSVGADPQRTQRAAELAKADLSTGMVGEFPELQGVMGRYYALHDGEDKAVAEAIAEHYSPLGPSDRCPAAPVSVAVALADKIDTLANFFAIDEKPTGSKDPYALRRAALGVIRLIIENKLRLRLLPVFRAAVAKGDPSAELLEFFADRLKVALRDQGVRHDLIAAVFAPNPNKGGGEDDLVRLLARVEALGAFLKSEDGANLLTAYRRASNIVRIEEGKDKTRYADPPDPARFREEAETVLAARLKNATAESIKAFEGENFAGAMAALARLRVPVDEFFNKVTVNTDDRELRANRLRLLSQIRDTLNRVADFSRIEG